MKRITFILVAVLLFTSCGIQKRKHLNGFYIPGKNHYKSQRLHSEKTNEYSVTIYSRNKNEDTVKAKESNFDKKVIQSKSVHIKMNAPLQPNLFELPQDRHDTKTNNFITKEHSKESQNKEIPAAEHTEKKLHKDAKLALIFTGGAILALIAFIASALIESWVLITISVFVFLGLAIAAFIMAKKARRNIEIEPHLYKGYAAANFVLWFWRIFLIAGIIAIGIAILSAVFWLF